MKKITYLLILMVVHITAYAQKSNIVLTDDLLPHKTQILAKYLPYGPGGFLNDYTLLSEEEVGRKLDSARADLLVEVSKISDPVLRSLTEGDIDYTCREALQKYQKNYGVNSEALVKLIDIVTKEGAKPENGKRDSALLKEAFTKDLTSPEVKELKERLSKEVYKNPDLTNAELYKRSAAYRSWVANYLTFLRTSKYKTDSSDNLLVELKVADAEIPAGLIRDIEIYRLTANALKLLKDSVEKEKIYHKFMNTATNDQHKKAIEDIYANYKMMISNAASPDFSFPDVNGKLVSLKSLRGKYVYIDVWATWCVPCKKEIPHLQKIEHNYSKKNIHFVSLSVDRMTNKDTWVSYVKDNKLGGIQVMADNDFKSDFIKKYNIISIPRFILIDPHGKIISGDAYRPSDPKLREQLDKLLK